MEKETKMGKNTVIMEKYNLMANIKMEKEMVKEKNIILKEN